MPADLVALCVMGRFYWRESARFLLQGKFAKAARRWRGHAVWRVNPDSVLVRAGKCAARSGPYALNTRNASACGTRRPSIVRISTEGFVILLLHPRTVTRFRNRRMPLSPLAIAAMLEGKHEYEIVDGNIDLDPSATLRDFARERKVEVLAVSVMPGPQMVHAIQLCKTFRAEFPKIPIVWGGYFASLYPDVALNSSYVDYVVRGQGEDAFLALLEAIAAPKPDLRSVPGISYKDAFGLRVHTQDRAIRSPGDFPWMPYHRLRHAEKYLTKTYLGSRTAVHQASYGCPFRCKFCGVAGVAQGRQKSERPERTAQILTHLQQQFAIDAVQFYDNNFFLREDDSRELAERITPLKLNWWCEGRIDILLRYSDQTLRTLRKSGCTMIFLGAESGSDAILEHDGKTAHQRADSGLGQTVAAFRHRAGIFFCDRQSAGASKGPGHQHAVHPKAKASQPGRRNYHPTLHADTTPRRHVWREIDDKLEIPENVRRKWAFAALVTTCRPQRALPALAAAPNKKAD